MPGPDGKLQAPHLAVSVFTRGLLRRLVTRIYFPDEPANSDDFALNLVEAERRGTLIAKKMESAISRPASSTRCPRSGAGSRCRSCSAGAPDSEVLKKIIDPPMDGYVGNVGRFMRRTKEADQLEKLDEIVAEITRVLEKKRDEIAKDPLSVSPARLMGLITEKVPEILDVTSPTPLTVQMAGLRVKLPYDTFAERLRHIEIEDGILLGDIAEVLPSRMRDYILVKVLPFSETNTVV